MQRKVAVSGDVSQLVAGNIVHEAPATVHQQNNTVTYNLLSGPGPKCLSWRQRQVISAKVDEVVQAEGVTRLAVYKTLLSDHDAQTMKAMPADRYRAIMDDLAVALSEAKSRATAANDAGATPVSAISSSPSIEHGPVVVAAPGRARLGALHWLVSICAVGASGFLMWDRVAAAPNEIGNCHFEGRQYSVGSVTTMQPAGVYECQAPSTAEDLPKWVPARNLGSGSKRRL